MGGQHPNPNQPPVQPQLQFQLQQQQQQQIQRNQLLQNNLQNNPNLNQQQAQLFLKRAADTNPNVISSQPNRGFKLRKPAEKTFSEKLTQLIPESKLYNELLETEKRLDSIMLRKRLELQDSKGKSCRVHRTLRLFISNSSSNQPGTSGSNPGLFPSWVLKIEGRMLDLPAVHSKHKHSVRKFSSLVKSMIVELDPTVVRDNNLIEWSPRAEVHEVDGFEIKRQGSANVRAKIALQMHHPTDRYLPSPELMDIINVSPAKEDRRYSSLVTKSDVITILWQYIKFYKLQDLQDRLAINCDERLEKLFTIKRFTFSQLPFMLDKHLLPPEPIIIDYIIRVDQPETTSPIVFDIEVETDDEFKSKITTIIGNNATNRSIYNLDEKIAQIMTNISNSKTKRDFMLDFIASPVDFINRWVASQAQDLEVLYGDTQVNLEEARQADFYNQDWTKEAVFHYLMSRTKENVVNSLLTKHGN